ncbi:MAG: hypothetical protein CMC79_02450 [Flavobacteriaceae bacterium]|nr:hypothetical protein [Flavobacteriaceae bacterium]|tara:strand:- start:55646 stop:56041 length:396 start_codon:yes stop_codon:yes gene_type:complete
MTSKKKNIIFYDGFCVFCNKTIMWVIKNDKVNQFRFSHVESVFSKSRSFIVTTNAISVLTEKGEYLQSSRAVLYLLKKINKHNFLLVIIERFPDKILNFVYNLIARNRYLIFGKYDKCHLPDKNLKSKFLQ